MPVFRQGRNPKELRDFYNSQKRIAEMDLLNNNQTGVIGAPMADVDGFNKLIKQYRKSCIPLTTSLIVKKFMYFV